MGETFGMVAMSLAIVALFAAQNVKDDYDLFKQQVCQEIVMEICE